MRGARWRGLRPGRSHDHPLREPRLPAEWGGRTFSQNFRHNADRPWEGHQFRAGPSEPWAAFHGRQGLEWRVFEFARRRNRTAAMRSISMGAPQIMGFNHARIGYDTVEEMFERFSTDVRYQVIGLFDFLAGGASNSTMLDALRRRDFGLFASRYNGPGQAAIYGELIRKHEERFERIRSASQRGRGIAATGTADTSAGSATRGRSAPGTIGPATRPERSYLVRSGDTLGAIAGRYGVPLAALIAANAIVNPNRIRVGLALRIPESEKPPALPVPVHQPPTDVDEDEPASTVRTYTIAPGDTLGAIARRLKVRVSVLVELNESANPDRIRVGQVLRLPD